MTNTQEREMWQKFWDSTPHFEPNTIPDYWLDRIAQRETALRLELEGEIGKMKQEYLDICEDYCRDKESSHHCVYKMMAEEYGHDGNILSAIARIFDTKEIKP